MSFKVRNFRSKCGSIDEANYYWREHNFKELDHQVNANNDDNETNDSLSLIENNRQSILQTLEVNSTVNRTNSSTNADEYLQPNIDASGYNVSIEDINVLSRRKKSSLKNSIYKIQNVRKYCDCIFVRLFYIMVPAFRIYISSCIYDESLFIIVYTCSAVIVLDLVYALWKRDALDYYWYFYTTLFTLFIVYHCFFFNLKTHITIFRFPFFWLVIKKEDFSIQ